MKQPIREQPTEPLAVRAAPSLIADLNRASKQTGASRSRLVRSFIEQGLKSLPKNWPKKIPRLQPRETRKFLNPIMTATTTKAVKATLSFSIQVQVSVQATEAKWKKLTKEYRDPNGSWADEADSVIDSFIDFDLGPVLKEELETRLLADMPTDPVFGLKTTTPVVDDIDFEGVELEEVEG